MPLTTGTRLGPYEISSPLGAGGMGEVYKARDTRLDRTVAIKVLPEHTADDPDVKKRFEREARTLAALSHPHICPVFDVGHQDGVDFLVMEYLEGETLARRIERGALLFDRALAIAVEIADALDKAHRQGIVHRDLKPGNVMLTKSGARLLDFGLATLQRVGAGGANGLSAATTQSDPATARGRLAGTLPYMAPEQLEAQRADARTDIFAFGAVLYEMVTGRRAFRGSSQASLMGAILKDQPPAVSSLQPGSPRALDRIVTTCLEKDPDERWQSAGDLRRELEWLRDDHGRAGRDTTPVRSRAWLSWAIAAIALSAALVAVLRQAPVAPPRPSEFIVSLAAEMSRVGQSDFGISDMPVPSPDGRSIVFRGNGPGDSSMLWIRSLESSHARPLIGTERADGAVVWSPDGAWIGFFADGRLEKIRTDGTPPETIAELPGFQQADWGSQGDILFRSSNRQPLSVIHETGGTPRQVTRLNEALTENSHRGPEFLPDGRRFLFTSRCADRNHNALYMASLDSPEVRRLMPAESHVSYVDAAGGRRGTLFYYNAGALVARPFDASSGTFLGEPILVTSDVRYVAASINAGFSVSADGSLIVVQPSGGNEARLTWFRRDGEEMGSVGPLGRPTQVRISPAADAVLFEAPHPLNGNRDVWHIDLTRGITTIITRDIANDWNPVWSPDGSRILFLSDRDGGSVGQTYLKTSLDPGADETPIPGLGEGEPHDWSRNGRWFTYGDDDIWVGSPSGDGEPFPFLHTSAYETNGRFSPDGNWIAYSSDETGSWEVHIRPFEGGPAGTDGRIQVSKDGGDFPVWGPDGRELFYLSGDDILYVVDTITLDRRGPVGPPSRLFEVCPDGRPIALAATGTPYLKPFDTIDGERFLISCREEPADQFLVLLDWTLPE